MSADAPVIIGSQITIEKTQRPRPTGRSTNVLWGQLYKRMPILDEQVMLAYTSRIIEQTFTAPPPVTALFRKTLSMLQTGVGKRQQQLG